MATEWSQESGMTSADADDNLVTYAEQAEASANAAATSATNAANSASAASTSASNAATSATGAAAQATNAATSATNAATSATNSANSATTASGHATDAATEAANAASSATSAATQATNAATSATNAATSETNAATHASNASTSATNAATSATAASGSATNAATAATNAAASETAAATSATEAASSATAADLSADTAFSLKLAAEAAESNASTSETNAAASAAAAATSETNAATSETNAATSATNAAASATAAATSEANAATSETNAATSEAAAATSEANAATSETNAAASAAAASTSETNAANSASAASTSETNAAASESAAATSETNAATSETNAAASAAAAATSETNAAASATDSEAARDAAQAAYDSFDDRYLGAKSSAPATDNDGNALLVGAIYWDTTDEQLYIWGGSAWAAASFDNANPSFASVTATTASFTNLSATNPDASLLPAGSEIMWPSSNISNIPAGWADTTLRLLSGTSERALISNIAVSYGANGLSADLVFDFDDEFYLANQAYETFSDVITHTRASNATMVDSDGLLKWAPHNLLSYSEQFDNAAWTKSNMAVTANAAVAPDGTSTADKLIENAASSSGRLLRTGYPDQPSTFSVFAKAAEWGFVQLAVYNGGTYTAVYVDLSDGSIIRDTTDGASVSSVGDGWYLISAPYASFDLAITIAGGDTSARTLNTGTGTTTSTGDGTSGIYIWGAHLYRSDLGGMVNNPDRGDSYVPTTSSAVYLPRRGHHVYDGTSWVNEGLLVESEARTNLLTYSSEFDNAAWSKSQSSVNANVAVSPDGLTSADKLKESTASAPHYIFQASNSALVTSATWTLSVYVKDAGDSRFVQLRPAGLGAGVAYATFDPTDGTLTESGGTDLVGTTSQSVGNGWYRVSMTCSADIVDTSDGVNITLSNSGTAGENPSYTGDGTSGIYIWGAQVEAASTPSSYIPTSGSTVTRAAETLTVPAAKLPYSSTAMSIQMQGRMTFSESDSNIFQYLWSADAQNIIYANNAASLLKQGFTQEALNVKDSVLTDVIYEADILVPFNISSRHGSTFINGAVDGVALTANTTPTALPDLSATDLQLGYVYMGTVKTFRMWADDLGDTGIEEASS